MRRAVWTVAGGAAVVLAVLFVGGLLLPESYELSRHVELTRPPEAAWRALTDSAALRRWRKDLIGLERAGERNGWPVWHEIGDDGRATEVTVVEATPPVHLRLARRPERSTRVTEWEYVVGRVPHGISVTLTERGTITNPIRRFVLQFLAGARGALDRQLGWLADFFDEPARVE